MLEWLHDERLAAAAPWILCAVFGFALWRALKEHPLERDEWPWLLFQMVVSIAAGWWALQSQDRPSWGGVILWGVFWAWIATRALSWTMDLPRRLRERKNRRPRTAA